MIARIATASDLNEPSLLDPLIASDGWQTLLAIAEESGTFFCAKCSLRSQSYVCTAPPSRPLNPPSSTAPIAEDGFEIPPDVYDEAGDPGEGAGGIVTCPHCTFENPRGRSDCEVCGLPLS